MQRKVDRLAWTTPAKEEHHLERRLPVVPGNVYHTSTLSHSHFLNPSPNLVAQSHPRPSPTSMSTASSVAQTFQFSVPRVDASYTKNSTLIESNGEHFRLREFIFYTKKIKNKEKKVDEEGGKGKEVTKNNHKIT